MHYERQSSPANIRSSGHGGLYDDVDLQYPENTQGRILDVHNLYCRSGFTYDELLRKGDLPGTSGRSGDRDRTPGDKL